MASSQQRPIGKSRILPYSHPSDLGGCGRDTQEWLYYRGLTAVSNRSPTCCRVQLSSCRVQLSCRLLAASSSEWLDQIAQPPNYGNNLVEPLPLFGYYFGWRRGPFSAAPTTPTSTRPVERCGFQSSLYSLLTDCYPFAASARLVATRL